MAGIVVVGAGAIGGMLAARLAAQGVRVALVGREAQVEAIRREGLRLREPAGFVRRFPVPATASVAEALAGEPPSLVALAVKTQDLAPVCRELAPLLASLPGVPVITLQNGVQADALAGAVLGRERIVGAVVMCAASALEPGQVEVQFPGWLVVGEPFGRVRRRTRQVAEVLGAAVPTYVTENLVGVRWSKLISNLNNGLCAATGLLMGELLEHPAGRVLPVRVMKEGYAVARAAGVRLDHGLYGLGGRALAGGWRTAAIAVLQSTMTLVLAWLPERVATSVLVAAGRSGLGRLPVRGSTWQSLARGRPSEIDFLNGEIVRRGEALGVPVPYNRRVVETVHEVERTRRFVPVAALWPAGVAGAGKGKVLGWSERHG